MERAVAQLGRLFRAVARPRHAAAAAAVAAALRALQRELVGCVLPRALQAGEGGGGEEAAAFHADAGAGTPKRTRTEAPEGGAARRERAAP